MENRLPIFVLDLVVFPQSKYPLHIFEERYKKMINLCISNNLGFGISVRVKDELNNIGCYVKIKEVTKVYESGEMDIIVEGEGRFSIEDLDMHPYGYYTARIKEYKDLYNKTDKEIADDVFDQYKRIINKVDIEMDDQFWTNLFDTDLKSFKFAEKSGLTLTEQLTFIQFRTEEERLFFLKNHFEKLEKQLEQTELVKQIMMNDGYIN